MLITFLGFWHFFHFKWLLFLNRHKFLQIIVYLIFCVGLVEGCCDCLIIFFIDWFGVEVGLDVGGQIINLIVRCFKFIGRLLKTITTVFISWNFSRVHLQHCLALNRIFWFSFHESCFWNIFRQLFIVIFDRFLFLNCLLFLLILFFDHSLLDLFYSVSHIDRLLKPRGKLFLKGCYWLGFFLVLGCYWTPCHRFFIVLIGKLFKWSSNMPTVF